MYILFSNKQKMEDFDTFFNLIFLKFTYFKRNIFD